MTPLPLSENDLIALFAPLENWQDRYRQLIKLATLLPDTAANKETTLHLPQYYVSGCENKVWLKASKQTNNTFLFTGDSDARVIKGLLSVVIILAQNKNIEQILTTHFDLVFKQLKFNDILSLSRLIGLKKITAHLLSQVNCQSNKRSARQPHTDTATPLYRQN